MTSAAPPPPHSLASQHQQQQQPQQQQQHHHQHHRQSNPPLPTPPVASNQLSSSVSPPSKRDLKSWWKGFKLPSKHQEVHGTATLPITYLPPKSTWFPVRRSMFVEDMEGSLSEDPSTVALLRRIISEEERRAVSSPKASANGSEPMQPSVTPQEVSKLDVLARILNWRIGNCVKGACEKPYRYGTRLIIPDAARPQGIFGVPLRQSITYANVAISLVDEDGKSYIYGYVPIVVAKCGVFLKERATEIEGIFRLSGSEKRIKELKNIFDSPDRYGKGLVWDGYTVHDAANVLRRYLNDLPEPVVPLDLYEKFRQPLRGATKQAVDNAEAGPQFVENFDMDAAIIRYQQLITELPPLNRQLLLYILDLLAVFAAKSDQNRMNSQNLAAIFQPGMLSHPNHAMAPEEYRLNQCVIIFLIENQDHFLIGMQGTATDEKTVREIQKGTPVVNAPPPLAPLTPSKNNGVQRSSSNASAGAESVAKNGSIRRNKSTSSRRSFQSNGAPSPGSPAVASTPTTSGGLNRSNTVPSKRSPALPSGRFGTRADAVAPLTPVTLQHPPTATAPPVAPPAVVEELATPPQEKSAPPVQVSAAPSGSLPALTVPEARSQDRLLEPVPPTPEVTTPSKERKLPILFQRINTSENEGPTKLRKKRLPGSANPSAHSSTASLPHSAAASPSTETTNPLEAIHSGSKLAIGETVAPAQAAGTVPQATQSGSDAPQAHPESQTLHPSSADVTLKTKKSPPTSLNSSFNESSDMDQIVDEQPPLVSSEVTSLESAEKDKKKRWRLSRKKEDPGPNYPPLSSPRLLGTIPNAEASSTSIGSSSFKPRPSMGDSIDRAVLSAELVGSISSMENKEDPKKLTSWIKNKYREHKESQEQRRNKSPPAPERSTSYGSSFVVTGRGKSLDLNRAEFESAGFGSTSQPPALQKQVPKMVDPNVRPSSQQH
ncbi:putative Rho-GTPase-activating protein [Podospora fimiseda]|uniref:Rho-GTPase-activating protein n=1 Tax=Podospora fimiseda TaxID=252190 RepID=A0AAN7BYZ3_9PEZI|nr:putative Rho-GTPase-activating protein [Podospora fimiseda]